ncbi:MAG: nitrilase-related carbon-nitrogen hydrolase, partial [Nitrosopumilus sp.]
MIHPYNIAIMQCNIRYILNPALKKEIISENLNRDLELIDGFMKFGGKPKIIQFPEFFLSGFWTGRSMKDWLEVAIQMPGDETDKIAQKAIEHNIYIAGNNYEVDPEWPGRYFNTSFLINPQGKIILKYRSLNVTSSTFS